MEAGALKEVGAWHTRLTQGRQPLLPPGPHSESPGSSGARVALGDIARPNLDIHGLVASLGRRKTLV